MLTLEPRVCVGKMGGVGIVGGRGPRGPVSEERDVAEEGRHDRVDVKEGSWC